MPGGRLLCRRRSLLQVEPQRIEQLVHARRVRRHVLREMELDGRLHHLRSRRFLQLPGRCVVIACGAIGRNAEQLDELLPQLCDAGIDPRRAVRFAQRLGGLVNGSRLVRVARRRLGFRIRRGREVRQFVGRHGNVVSREIVLYFVYHLIGLTNGRDVVHVVRREVHRRRLVCLVPDRSRERFAHDR